MEAEEIYRRLEVCQRSLAQAKAREQELLAQVQQVKTSPPELVAENKRLNERCDQLVKLVDDAIKERKKLTESGQWLKVAEERANLEQEIARLRAQAPATKVLAQLRERDARIAELERQLADQKDTFDTHRKLLELQLLNMHQRIKEEQDKNKSNLK